MGRIRATRRRRGAERDVVAAKRLKTVAIISPRGAVRFHGVVGREMARTLTLDAVPRGGHRRRRGGGRRTGGATRRPCKNGGRVGMSVVADRPRPFDGVAGLVMVMAVVRRRRNGSFILCNHGRWQPCRMYPPDSFVCLFLRLVVVWGCMQLHPRLGRGRRKKTNG